MTQESLRRTVAKLNSGAIQNERGTVQQFAYGVALNVGREFHKRRRLHLLEPDKLDELPTDDSYSNSEHSLTLARRSQQLRQAIAELSSTESEIIGLLIDHDLDLSAIAQLVDLPIGTVKSHISRAKQKLKQMLNPGDSNGLA